MSRLNYLVIMMDSGVEDEVFVPVQFDEIFEITREDCLHVLKSSYASEKNRTFPVFGIRDMVKLRDNGNFCVDPSLWSVPAPFPFVCRAETDEQVIQWLTSRVPVLELLWSESRKCPDCSILVVGGSVVSAVCDSELNDVDIVFVGSCEAATQLLLHLGQVIENMEAEGTEEVYWSCTRSQRLISFSGLGVTLQFVICCFESVGAALINCDIGASAVGVTDEGKVVCLYEGAFCLATGCIPVDASRRSFSYDDRLCKYWRWKGFTLLLPGLSPIASSFDIGSMKFEFTDSGLTFTSTHCCETAGYDVGKSNLALLVEGNFKLIRATGATFGAVISDPVVLYDHVIELGLTYRAPSLLEGIHDFELFQSICENVKTFNNIARLELDKRKQEVLMGFQNISWSKRFDRIKDDPRNWYGPDSYYRISVGVPDYTFWVLKQLFPVEIVFVVCFWLIQSDVVFDLNVFLNIKY